MGPFCIYSKVINKTIPSPPDSLAEKKMIF